MKTIILSMLVILLLAVGCAQQVVEPVEDIEVVEPEDVSDDMTESAGSIDEEVIEEEAEVDSVESQDETTE